MKFADGAANDITTIAGAVQMLVASNAISMQTRLQMIHPDWTQKQLADEIQRIQQETAQAAMQAAMVKAASSQQRIEPTEPTEEPTEQPTEEQAQEETAEEMA